MPSVITAGDTLLFSQTLSSFPADTWTVAYALRCATGGQIDFTATADGTKHLVNVSAVTTGTWFVGSYSGFGRATHKTDSSQSAVCWQGEFEVKPDLTQAGMDFDPRSWAKKCLDSIEAVLQGKAGKDVLNSTIAGQSIGRMTPEQLFTLRDRFKAEYQAEQAAAASGQGKPQQSNIAITFVNP